MIGGDDRDEIDAIAPRSFGTEHGIERWVGARRIDPVGIACRRAALRITGKDARDEFDLSVQLGGKAMHRADERPRPATDHAHSQTPHPQTPGYF